MLLPVNLGVGREVVEALVGGEHLELVPRVAVVDEDALVLAPALEEGAHVREVDGGVGGEARVDHVVVLVGVETVVHVGAATVHRMLKMF